METGAVQAMPIRSWCGRARADKKSGGQEQAKVTWLPLGWKTPVGLRACSRLEGGVHPAWHPLTAQPSGI